MKITIKKVNKMPYFNMKFTFPSEEKAFCFFNSAKEKWNMEFDFYHNKNNVSPSFYDVEYYDDEDNKIPEEIVRKSIKESIKNINSLFMQAMAEDADFCYVSGNDSKYCSMVFIPGEEEELLEECICNKNWVGAGNLLKWDISAWLFMVKKEIALSSFNSSLKITLHYKETLMDWISFFDSAGKMLQGMKNDKSYENTEIQRILFTWKGEKIPDNLKEALSFMKFHLEEKENYYLFKSEENLPSLWSNIVRRIDL